MQKTSQDMMIEQTLADRNASKDENCSQGKLELFFKREIASAVLLSIAAGIANA